MLQNYLFCQFLMIHIKSERLRQGEIFFGLKQGLNQPLQSFYSLRMLFLQQSNEVVSKNLILCSSPWDSRRQDLPVDPGIGATQLA